MSLINAMQLAERIERGSAVRVADVRWYLNRPGEGRAAYARGHIPGAIFLDVDTDLADAEGLGSPGRHPLPRPAEFARRLSQLGIGSQHFVVAYDDMGGINAARLWWMLDDLGHRGGVAVLDGGLQAWQRAGLPLSSEEPSYPPARLELGDAWRRVTDRHELAARLGAVTLLDARAPERYRGDVEPVDPLAGHIPTAVSAPTAGNMNADGEMLPVEALRERYSPFVSASGVVVSCGSGTTACHDALAMRLAGLPDPILYAGSFSDWSRSGLPVTSGEEPGAPPQLDSP
ncbi:MAG TPA: sulfurtransferase [Candidatus Limnocylindrales bacterium]|nr:sulfurtransferase [Candidatus Limnocylindrales bacterium]